MVCRKCDIQLEKLAPRRASESDKEYEKREKNSTVESKPSKYHHWECEKCGERMDDKPDKKTRIAPDNWVYIHKKYGDEECGGIIYNIGRKFYHIECYDGMHYGSLIVAWDHFNEGILSRIKRRLFWM